MGHNKTTMYKSNIKEDIAKRYTWRFTFNKWREAVSEYLWLVTAYAFGFFFAMYFGGHLIAQCLAN